MIPKYWIGDHVMFSYRPEQKIDPETGEITPALPEYPGVIIGMAHSLDLGGPAGVIPVNGVDLHRVFDKNYQTFIYQVKLDPELIEALDLEPMGHKDGQSMRTEVIYEYMITGQEIEF